MYMQFRRKLIIKFILKQSINLGLGNVKFVDIKVWVTASPVWPARSAGLCYMIYYIFCQKRVPYPVMYHLSCLMTSLVWSLSSQYPRMVVYPLVHNSPGTPIGNNSSSSFTTFAYNESRWRNLHSTNFIVISGNQDANNYLSISFRLRGNQERDYKFMSNNQKNIKWRHTVLVLPVTIHVFHIKVAFERSNRMGLFTWRGSSMKETSYLNMRVCSPDCRNTFFHSIVSEALKRNWAVFRCTIANLKTTEHMLCLCRQYL